MDSTPTPPSTRQKESVPLLITADAVLLRVWKYMLPYLLISPFSKSYCLFTRLSHWGVGGGGGKSAVFTCSSHVLSTSFLASSWAIMFQECLALNSQFSAVLHCPPLKFMWPSWDHRGGYRKTVLHLSSRLGWVNPLRDQRRALQAVRFSMAAAQFAPSRLSKAAHAFNSVPFWLQ